MSAASLSLRRQYPQRLGTTVNLFLRKADAVPVATVTKPAVNIAPMRSGRILLVDDDASVRLSTRAIRTIEHNGGIDAYLLSTNASKLTERGQDLKRKITSAKAKRAAAQAS